MGLWGPETQDPVFTSAFGDKSSNLGNWKHEEFTIYTCNFYNRLFSIGKNGFITRIYDIQM